MKDKAHILVTGGAGYIGSHTCKMLSKLGYVPVVFDNLSNGHRHAVKYGPFIKGDLKNPKDIAKAFKKYKFSAVIHFASYIEVGESVADPAKYYSNNIGGALNLLNAMRDAGVMNIVFSSTCAIYGAPEAVPITEDTQANPLSPYGFSKFAIERILQDDERAHGLKFVSCRYFNACGADPEGELGEEHNPETHIIPRLLMAARGDTSSFDIYGTDYDTKDGTCIRDYIHVQDLAEAHVLALRHLLDGSPSCAVNLGSGTGYSVREIIKTVEKITGRPITIQEKPRRPGDPPVLLADTAQAAKLLNFKVKFTSLEEMIQTAWDFYQK